MFGILSRCVVSLILVTAGVPSLALNKSEDEVSHKEASCGMYPPKKTNSMGVAWQEMLASVDLAAVNETLLAAIAEGNDSAQKTLTMSLNQVMVMVATRAGWHKPCHMHPSDAHMTVLQGSFAFKLHTLSSLYVLEPGDTFVVPKWHPHAEGTHGVHTAVFLVTWSPIPRDKINLTIYVSEKECDIHHLPVAELPSLTDRNSSSLYHFLPKEWSATALLHPFSPPQTGTLEKDSLFAQLGIAKLSYSSKRKLFYINVQGCKEGRWQYKMDDKHTYIWKDEKWTKVDMGWDFPNRDWLGPNAVYVGSSPLNWMKEDKDMAWWKQPHDRSATWFWFDKKGAPFRIMFGVPPPSTSKGNRSQLAFFQMFSFSYIVNFDPVFMVSEEIFNNEAIRSFTSDIGLECGNPDSFKVFNWTSHFSMSAMMIPVDFRHNPLPTYVSYRWDYGSWNGRRNGRVQTTTMYYTYNTDPERIQTAALFGDWPNTPHRSDGYLLDYNMETWTNRCERLLVDGDVIGQEPPWWPKLGSAQIMAVIRKPASARHDWVSPLTGTNRTVAILGVLFPPHLPQYPDSTYLWTWYDYTEFSGGQGPARPITFMQSASTIGPGTSLALADYFQYYQLDEDVHIHTEYLHDTIKETCPITPKETGSGGGTGRHHKQGILMMILKTILVSILAAY